MMKAALLILAMGGFCTSAFATQSSETATNSNLPVEHYSYSTHLDINKVLSNTPPTDSCDVGNARMDYLDSKGKEHILKYLVMGGGCTGG